MRIYKIVGIVLSAILLLASCTNSDLEKKKVKIAYANWLEGIAMSHLAKVVLEEHGYEVELQNADPVSYTHLDVYKRQASYRSFKESCFLACFVGYDSGGDWL